MLVTRPRKGLARLQTDHFFILQLPTPGPENDAIPKVGMPPSPQEPPLFGPTRNLPIARVRPFHTETTSDTP